MYTRRIDELLLELGRTRGELTRAREDLRVAHADLERARFDLELERESAKEQFDIYKEDREEIQYLHRYSGDLLEEVARLKREKAEYLTRIRDQTRRLKSESQKTYKFQQMIHRLENLESKLKKTQVSEEKQKECSICLTAMTQQQNTVFTPCVHQFHRDCLLKSLQFNTTCPMCRFSLNVRDYQ